jgi:hypothetical protein
MRDFALKPDQPHFVISAGINGAEFLLVAIRLRLKRTNYTNYLGIFLPVPEQDIDKFYREMKNIKEKYSGATFKFSRESILQ